MQTIWQDLRFAARMLWKRGGLTLIAVLTLGLGIGASTSIFSIVDGVLLRPLPYPEPDRIVQMREVNEKGVRIPVAEPNYLDARARNRTLEKIAQFAGGSVIVTGADANVRARAFWVSGEFFDVLRARAFAGRLFLPEESQPGGDRVAVVSYGFWQRLLGGRADFNQTRLNVDGTVFTVVGVMAPGFNYPLDAEVWVPREVEPAQTSRTAHNWSVIARLRDGVTLEEARADLSAIGKQLRQELGRETDAVDLALIPLHEYLTERSRQGLLILLAAVGLLLLVACANVANLVLAQVTSRATELAVRSALGASRLRLARQLVTENLLLSISGGILGVVLSLWSAGLLLSLNGYNLPRADEIAINARALLFTLGLALLIAIVLGLVPLWRLPIGDLQGGLKEAGRGQAGAGGRLRSLLVISQVAVTLVLLVGAGLLVRSFRALVTTDPGFRPESAIAMTLSLPTTVNEEQEQRLAQFHEQLLERLERLPGVIAAGAINALPLAGRGANGTFLKDNNPATTGQAEYRLASAGYFKAMGIPLLRGRFFDERDTGNAPDAALVSRSLAETYFANEDPIGRTIQFGNMDGDLQLLHIVGVVGDVRDRGLDREARPAVYAHSRQRPQWRQVANQAYVVRAQIDPTTLAPQMRAEVEALSREAVISFQTLEQVFSSSLDERRFNLVIFGFFAAVALLLAAAGVYGVLSYTVTQRTHEIGVRLALGAQPRAVLGMVIWQGMRLILAGAVVGAIGSLILARSLESMLYGVSARDPLTFVTVALLLIAVAMAACYVPARRATRVDPLIALRYE